MAYNEVFNPLGGEHGKGGFDYTGSADPFITTSSNGVTTIRWQSTPGGNPFGKHWWWYDRPQPYHARCRGLTKVAFSCTVPVRESKKGSLSTNLLKQVKQGTNYESTI